MVRTFLDSGVLLVAARSAGGDRERALEILSDLDRDFVTSPFVYLELVPKAIFHKKALEKSFYEEFFKLPIVSLSGGSLEAVVGASGDVAYDIGWNRLQLQGAPADSGKYLAVWRKVDGSWKIAAVSFSSNGPPKK